MTRGPGGIMLIVAATAVGAAVITGILMLGSPAIQRQQRLDFVPQPFRVNKRRYINPCPSRPVAR